MKTFNEWLKNKLQEELDATNSQIPTNPAIQHGLDKFKLANQHNFLNPQQQDAELTNAAQAIYARNPQHIVQALNKTRQQIQQQQQNQNPQNPNAQPPQQNMNGQQPGQPGQQPPPPGSPNPYLPPGQSGDPNGPTAG